MARRRIRDSWVARGASDAELGWVADVLDPDVLTIGFARRVPSYKRLTLMLRDPARLRSMLLHPERPVQLVIAGKAHPADDGGKGLIQHLVQFADENDVRHRVVFLPNYDIGMATVLYPGCDVWLNNPLRPLEACGTSGMKAALNGALNLSILDGWWDEWFDGENGWAIPTADGVDDPDRRDDLEAAALYDLIEKSVATTFYATDDDGLPARWISMVRHTLQTLGPKVLASRMVRDYVQQLYQPAALASRRFSGPQGTTLARDLSTWKVRVRAAWPTVRVEHVETSGVGDSPMLGAELTVRAFVSLGTLMPDDVEVEVVHGRVDANDRIVDPRTEILRPLEQYEGNRWRCEVVVPLERTGPFGYTVRVRPRHVGLASSAELGLETLPPEPVGMAEGVLR
jgi:starch phosphorylase